MTPKKSTPNPKNEKENEERIAIQYVPLTDAVKLVWRENAKKHDLGALIQSLQVNGMIDPPKLDQRLNKGKGGIIYGNGRVEALLKMKQTGMPVPRGVVVRKQDGEWLIPLKVGVDAVNENQAIAAALDHNNITMMGGDFSAVDMAQMWDLESYNNTLQKLARDGTFAVSVSGEDVDLLNSLVLEGRTKPDDAVDDEGADQLDRAEELLAKWRVKKGEIYEAGLQRIACGDSTDERVFEALCKDERAQLTWTDPPYGVKYGDKMEKANPTGYKVRQIQNDNLPADKLEILIRTALSNCAKFSLPGAAIYVASPPGTLLPVLISSFTGSGFDYRWGLIWLKDQIVLSRADYHFKHENILYGWKPDGAHYFIDDRKQPSVFEYPRPKRSPDHPTMKPVGLIKHMLSNSSKMGDVVLDPFCGSGSTLLACQKLSRRGRGIELEPKFTAVVLERLSLLGLTPVKIGQVK